MVYTRQGFKAASSNHDSFNSRVEILPLLQPFPESCLSSTPSQGQGSRGLRLLKLNTYPGCPHFRAADAPCLRCHLQIYLIPYVILCFCCS